jgi:hypothetical protein
VPWARPGSGFTAAFEALALALCRELPVRQAASCCAARTSELWRRIEFYVDQARAWKSFAGVQIVGIDETSLRRGQHYITVVHDLDAKRLLFATEGRDHQTVVDFAADLKAHGGDPAEVRHVCMDMSAAYAKGVGMALPQADISYDRFHVVAMAIQAMDDVRREELRTEPAQVAAALLGADPRRGETCCGVCARTRPAGPPHRPPRCTGCSARRSRANARGGCAWRCARSTHAPASTTTPCRPQATWPPGRVGPGAAGWSRSRSWLPRSRSASTRSCVACSITAATPLSSQ